MKKANSVAVAVKSISNGRFTQSAREFSVSDSLYLQGMKLTSLVGAPGIVMSKVFIDDNRLTSLEGLPETVGEMIYARRNKIKSLQNIHNIVRSVGLSAPSGGYIFLQSNPIKSHILGLLKIEGLMMVELDNKPVQNIINKYLLGTKDILDCQEELIEAGFDKFAQL